MSLKKNIFANYASQIYVVAISIGLLPLYLKFLGAESFGLVAFFGMLQAWFLLLDFGLPSTMAREAARFQGRTADGVMFRQLLRSMEWVFLSIGIVGGTVIILGAQLIADHWLVAKYLSNSEIVRSLRFMALVIILRWMGELYRGVINGYERMVWLGVFNATMATFKFVVVIPLFIYFDIGVAEFFFFQLLIAVIEVLVLVHRAYILLPVVPAGSIGCNWTPFRQVMKFSLAMSLASVVWLCVSQVDKLLLSGLLSLADYGWFSLTTTAASGVLLLSSPIVVALMPRLANLCARGDEGALIALYRVSTQWIGVVVWSVSGVLAWQAERVMWIWTGDSQLASSSAPILQLYALGNAVMALGALPYYLQFARGNLRLHLIGTTVFLAVLVLCMLWAVERDGALGAALAWLLVNVLYFLCWTPVAHARFACGVHISWIVRDIMPIATLASLVAWMSVLLPWPAQRLQAGGLLVVVSGFVLVSAMVGSSWCRSVLLVGLLNWKIGTKLEPSSPLRRNSENT